ncbi:MAG: phosphatidylserine decarboxylase [Desulfarculus sp.]|nr:phosphatidylserine decarboxylase [Desulfarculus sp.]
MHRLPHQYIDRRTGRAVTEKLIADSTVNFLYQRVREKAPQAFQALTSARACGLLGWLRYDLALGRRLGGQGLLSSLGVRVNELLDDPGQLDTPRKVFERRIRYWQCRPMPDDASAVVSPSDSRVLMGSLAETSALFIKEKFFSLAELLGGVGSRWWQAFQGGDYAIFRLTPDKYHYNHTPVSGRVVAHFQLDGAFHSCNHGFQPGRVAFAPDLLANLRAPGVATRFSQGLGPPLVETEVEVRAPIASALQTGQVAHRYMGKEICD